MPEHTDFTGGVAVITGAGSGLGAGLVEEAVSRGMRVLLADVHADGIEQASAAHNAAGAETAAMQADVRDPLQVEALAAYAFDRWGRVDLLVNNAGIEAHGYLWEIPVDLWNAVIDVNLNGVFYGMRSFIPRMLELGNTAHIVNISSVAGLYIRTHTSPYGASKHANLALTEIVSDELAEVTDRIHVTAVLPGAMNTAIFDNAVSVKGDGPGEQDRQDMAARLRATGMSPRDAARIVFQGASERRLRVHTDLEQSRTSIQERTDSLFASLVPVDV
jgi:NAD(P)-dependent dehydrogenase (short-subunit alcohol dehydrogenase family)